MKKPKKFKRVVETEENHYLAISMSYVVLYLGGMILLYPGPLHSYYLFIISGLLLFPIINWVITGRKIYYIEVKDDE